MARRGSSTSELQKKRKKNPLVSTKNNKLTGGEQYKTSVRNQNVSKDNNKVNKDKPKAKGKTTVMKNFIKHEGRMYKKTSNKAKDIMKKLKIKKK